MSAMRLNPLSEADLDKLHAAALSVLHNPGARIMSAPARDLLLAHGATLEGEDLVRIPASLVEQSLASAPKRFTIYDRDGEPALDLGAGNVYVGTGVTNLNYLDPRDFDVKDFTLPAVAETALLTDALPNIDFLATPGVVRASDELPQSIVNQCEFREMVTNTKKPLMVLIAGGPELSDIYEMAELVAGGKDAFKTKPFVIPYLNSVSPMLFNPETLDKLLIAAERGVPVVCQAAPQVGATGPVTIAGTLVISAAETLVGLVLSQLCNPGTPFISGTVPFLMDMRYGSVTAGGPDGVRFMVAMGQLCRRWGLPLVGMSFGGDSKDADEQAALEAGFYGFGTVLAGVDLVFDAGCIEGGLLFSPELLVMSDELADMTRRVAEPLEISEETIALGVIEAVGIGNVFLGEDHTLEHFRELWTPRMLDWRGRREWELDGSKTLRTRCRERVFQIWETHKVDPLPDEVLAGLDRIIETRRSAGNDR